MCLGLSMCWKIEIRGTELRTAATKKKKKVHLQSKLHWGAGARTVMIERFVLFFYLFFFHLACWWHRCHRWPAWQRPPPKSTDPTVHFRESEVLHQKLQWRSPPPSPTFSSVPFDIWEEQPQLHTIYRFAWLKTVFPIGHIMQKTQGFCQESCYWQKLFCCSC